MSKRRREDRPTARKGATKKQKTRAGYSSVARSRGASVTGEMKYFDTELQLTNLSAVTTTWVAGTLQDPGTSINLGDAAVATPGCLCAPKVSSALNGRQARDIQMCSVKVNGYLAVPAQAAQNSADQAANIRLCLVMDTQTNSSALTPANVFHDGGGASTTIGAFQNPDFFGRYRVLRDKRFGLSNLNMTGSPTAGDVVQGSIKRPFKLKYKFKKPLKVRFNNTNGGTVADIIDNSLHIVCGTESVALSPQIAYYARVGYKE